MGRNYVSIPEFQRLHSWSFGMHEKNSYLNLLDIWTCAYSSTMLVIKRRRRCPADCVIAFLIIDLYLFDDPLWKNPFMASWWPSDSFHYSCDRSRLHAITCNHNRAYSVSHDNDDKHNTAYIDKYDKHNNGDDNNDDDHNHADNNDSRTQYWW